MIMLAGRPRIYVRLGRKCRTARLRRVKAVSHGARIDSLAQSQKHFGVWRSIEQVVAFILRVWHSEMLADVAAQRMHLERQVASLHGVEEVETYRELGAEFAHDP